MSDRTAIRNSPLKLFQPMNIIVFLSFYSPIIVATSITSLSFIFQNFKGLIYLGFLLACCVVRSYIYMASGGTPVVDDNTICTSVQYSQYGNPTFSSFVFSFTIMYLSLPMFSRGAPNYWVFSSLITYFLVDMFLKLYKGCIVSYGDLLLNVLLGTAFDAAFITAMYAGGSGKYLLFNEVASNREICTQPKTQTFKCNLYKNGELVGNI